MKRILPILFILMLAGAARGELVHAACTDFSSGMLSILEAADPWTGYPDELSIHSDAVLRWGGEQLVIIERFGVDAIRALDAETLGFVSQFSTGTASNPQDLIVVGDKAYISCNNTNAILVVQWPSGAPLGSVDLSAWADADGYCEPAGLILAEDLIFAAIQRLDRNFYWQPVGDSYLAVLNPATDTLVDVNSGQAGVQAIALPASNPTGELQAFGGAIWLSCAGSLGLADGGLVRVDPLSYTCEQAIAETSFGGDIGDVVFVDAERAYAIVTDAGFNTHLYRFDPSDFGSAPERVLTGGDWIFTDMELYGGVLFLADRSYGTDGVRVLDALTVETLSPKVDLGLPPYDLLVPLPDVVDAPPPPASTVRLSAWPNPFNPSTTIRFELKQADETTLTIFDSSGRKVRTLLDRVILDAGAEEILWDGRNDRAESLPSGMYHAKLDAGESSLAVKLVLLK